MVWPSLGGGSECVIVAYWISWRLIYFSKWRPSAILDPSDALLNHLWRWCLQSLVGFDAVISKVLIFCTVKRLFTTQNRVLGFHPLNGQHYQKHPQKVHFSGKARHTTYRSLRSIQPFFHSSPFILSSESYALQWMLFTRPDTPKVPLPVRTSAPSSNTWFPGPTRLKIPNSISLGSAVFLGERL